MRARTHETDEKRAKTSSHSNETISVEEGKQTGLNAQSKADGKLGPTGLTVGDIAGQSAYERDKADVSERVAGSDRDKQA
jgi:hypothetical protein